MASDIPSLLAELERLSKGATPEPFCSKHYRVCRVLYDASGAPILCKWICDTATTKKNRTPEAQATADLIAFLRNHSATFAAWGRVAIEAEAFLDMLDNSEDEADSSALRAALSALSPAQEQPDNGR